jgi:hypothetical protein
MYKLVISLPVGTNAGLVAQEDKSTATCMVRTTHEDTPEKDANFALRQQIA